LGHESHHLSPSSAKDKKEQSNISTPLYAFVVCTGIALSSLYTYFNSFHTQNYLSKREREKEGHQSLMKLSHMHLLLKKAVKSLFYNDNHLNIVSVKVTNVWNLVSYSLHSVKLEHNDKFTSNFFWLKAYCHG
jgi:hypothetical protein